MCGFFDSNNNNPRRGNNNNDRLWKNLYSTDNTPAFADMDPNARESDIVNPQEGSFAVQY